MHPFPIIFSDLDSTLLDSKTYSWKAAEPALDLIQKKAIPLILCSSKTRAEIETIRDQLDNHDPFISENGGGVFIPETYFDFSFAFHKETAHYKIIELGAPYVRLRKVLRTAAQQSGIEIKGFGDISAGEIAAQTGLSFEEARMAKQRGYDEPFILTGNEEQKKQVLQLITQLGLHWTRGSRYYHLTGANDKGKAVRILTDLFRQKFREIITVGLGDSPNDLPMLSVVDYPVLVQKPGGRYEDSIFLSGLIKAEGVGPAGWKMAILNLLAGMKD
jgi:mannosyl-3-phosphoglycerate phosphatase